MPQQLNRIQVRTLTWPLQNLNLVFLEPFRGGLAGVFGIVVLLHNPSVLEFEVTNWWLDILLQVLKLQSSPRPSHYHHHVWLLVWCSFYEMLCWFYTRCNGTHTFQKVQLLFHQSTEYLPKSLGDNQDIFWQMWDEPLSSFWSAMAFALELSHGCCFCPVSFLLFQIQIVESWTLTSIEASEACSSLDVVLGSFMTSWMSCHCALGVILVGRPLLGRFTTAPIFSICG